MTHDQQKWKMDQQNRSWLVVWTLPLWKMMELKSVGIMNFPLYRKVIKIMFQTTNQGGLNTRYDKPTLRYIFGMSRSLSKQGSRTASRFKGISVAWVTQNIQYYVYITYIYIYIMYIYNILCIYIYTYIAMLHRMTAPFGSPIIYPRWLAFF